MLLAENRVFVLYGRYDDFQCEVQIAEVRIAGLNAKYRPLKFGLKVSMRSTDH